jgi:hypothetical protein
LVQALQLVELDALIFTVQHLLQSTEAVISKSCILVNAVLDTGEYSL